MITRHRGQKRRLSHDAKEELTGCVPPWGFAKTDWDESIHMTASKPIMIVLLGAVKEVLGWSNKLMEDEV